MSVQSTHTLCSDINVPYYLHCDASKYGYDSIPTQLSSGSSPQQEMCYPMMYVSGTFIKSQINYPSLVKEAYTIYTFIKKVNVYLEDAKMILQTHDKLI